MEPVYWIWNKLASAKWEDAWVERLASLPPGRLIISQKPGARFLRLEAWMDSQAEAAKLVHAFGGGIRKSSAQPPGGNHAEAQPIQVGKRLVVVRDAETPVPSGLQARARLIVPAANAFGTGDHATTGMCLRLLEEESRALTQGWRFLDYGCGTGILALAASKFGSARSIGIDFDPAAVRAAKENATQNQIRNVSFKKADVLSWTPPFPAEICAANLFLNLLIPSLPQLREHTTPGGKIILSGLLASQEDEARGAAANAGLKLLKRRRKGKWCALLLARSF